ncbi:MAG: EAL domain-containing protein [Burkholderiales bacterium]|nr:EAL domain-containing protein [Burkholderiales bacterium]
MANRILILSADAAETAMLHQVLGAAREQPFDLETIASLSSGITRVGQGQIDAIILDLTLPDCMGHANFSRMYACTPEIPILVMCPWEQEELAISCVHSGAQGYLLKGHFSSYLLAQGLRSVIARKELEAVFYKEKARAEIALNSIGDAVICTDLQGNIDYLNVAAEKLTLWSREQANGHPFSEVFNIINADTRNAERNTVELVLQQKQTIGLPPDTILIKRDGSEASIEDSAAPINDLSGRQTGVVVVFHDVSAAQIMSKKMAFLAQHDFLTNLPNRLMLNDRIEQAITMAKRNQTQLAILFLDLDNFKHINDSLGHAIGDKLLQSVSKRLAACVRDSDTVSRQGGDEFVILLAESESEINTAIIANKILQLLACPHYLLECELHITTSIGVSVYPLDGEDAETMIKSADIAMYHAKEHGRNNFQFFRSDMNTRAIERQKIEAHLRVALEKQEFVLHYQPQVNLKTGKVTGAEALIRWMHGDMGMVMPARFISIAEDSGLIVPIGRWVLREACLQAQRWNLQGFAPVSISVNISAVEFRQKNFLQGVQNILQETGLNASQLELEITESVLMRDAQASIAILQELKEMGVRLAVDDFGTGYSSLSYLEQFPLDVLKIDQSFVQDIPANGSNRIIISAVIGMGNSLQLRVIAEGIENQVQLNFLQAQQCHEGQGFFLSRPLTVEQFGRMLLRKNHALLAL